MPSPVLQFKRGPSSNIGVTSFRAGEPGFTTDRYDFYIGLDNTIANNKFFGSSRYWVREDGTSALKLNLVDKDGVKFISLKSPDTISGAGVTYTFPETIVDGYFLKTNSNGTLEWSNQLPEASFSGITTFNDTTDSTSYTNGAVQIAGGLGVSKSVNIGGNIYVSGISTFNGLTITNNNLDVQAHAEIQELSVVGIASVSGDLMVDGTILADSDVRILGITTVANSTDSTASNNGSFIFDGGIGVQKSANVGGNLSVSGVSTFTGFSDFNGGIDVTGHTELDNLNVSGVTTSANLTVTSTASIQNLTVSGLLFADLTGNVNSTGSNTFGQISVSGLSTFTGFSDFNGGIDVLGNSEFDYVNVSGITTTRTFKLNGTSGIGITGISSSTTLAENSNSYLPTQAAVKAYVDAVDLTLGLNADSGGPSTVNTSQTLTISGTLNEVNTSVSGQTVTVGLPDIVNVTTSIDVPTIEVTNVKARDGANAITITNTTGAVGFANSVTISGDLYVLGNTTEVNTSALKVEDTLIDLGLVNSGGSLVPPSSDLNLDLGIIFNWYNGSAKKASVYWDDSLQRVGIASDVTESNGVLTANAYASLQIKDLWVSDCAGTSQVISCTSSQRFLENITVDCGTF
jgi:hypothetical protein